MTKKERQIVRRKQADAVVNELVKVFWLSLADDDHQKMAKVHLTIGGTRLFTNIIATALGEAECRGLDRAIQIMKS